MEATIITLVIGFLQAVIIFILVGIKKDQADMWKRMNSHYHTATCDNAGCRTLKTGNVVIPGSE